MISSEELSTAPITQHEISYGSPKSIFEFMNCEEVQADRSHILRPTLSTPQPTNRKNSEDFTNRPPILRLKQRYDHNNSPWNIDASYSQGNQRPEAEPNPIFGRTTTGYVPFEDSTACRVLELRVEQIPSTLVMPMDF